MGRLDNISLSDIDIVYVATNFPTFCSFFWTLNHYYLIGIIISPFCRHWDDTDGIKVRWKMHLTFVDDTKRNCTLRWKVFQILRFWLKITIVDEKNGLTFNKCNIRGESTIRNVRKWKKGISGISIIITPTEDFNATIRKKPSNIVNKVFFFILWENQELLLKHVTENSKSRFLEDPYQDKSIIHELFTTNTFINQMTKFCVNEIWKNLNYSGPFIRMRCKRGGIER